MKKTLPIFILLLAFGLFSASFASAATPVYFSVGQDSTTDRKTCAGGDCGVTPLTVSLSTGVATFSEAQTGNIGVGDAVTYDTDKVCYISSKTSTAVWNCVTVVGAVPADIAGSTVVSIKRVFTSLSGAESGAPALLGTSDLVAGNFQVNFPCYYDTGADPNAVTIDGWTTGVDNYIKVYTPNDTATEVNFSQRHEGKWDEGKYRLINNDWGNAINAWSAGYTEIDGLQILNQPTSGYDQDGIVMSSGKASNNLIDYNGINGTSLSGIVVGANSITYNNNVYNFFTGISSACGGDVLRCYVYNNTIYNSSIRGIRCNQWRDTLLLNNIVQDSGTIDYSGAYHLDSNYNLSSDSTAPGANSITNSTVEFVDEDNDDFRLSLDDTSGAIDGGTDLSAQMDAVDIMGNSRPRGLAWDIGAHEAPVEIFRSVGPGATTSLNTDSRTVEISGSTATFSGAMPNNVGVGDVLQYQVDSTYHLAFIQSRTSDTVYQIRKADGTAPTATPAGTAVSVFRAYTSLSNAEAGTENTGIESTVRNFDTWTGGRDLVSNNEQWNIACYANGSTADTTAVSINGWTTGEHHYLKVYTPVLSSEVGISQRHGGKWDEGKYRLSSTSGHTFNIVLSQGGLKIDGLQLGIIGPSDNDGYGFLFSAWYEIVDVELSNNIISYIGSISAPQTRIGIYLHGQGGGYLHKNIKIWNNLIYGFKSSQGAGIYIGSGYNIDSDIIFYNNTLYNNTEGIAIWSNNAAVMKNNLATDNDVDYVIGGGTYYPHASSTHNLSSDATAPGSNSITNVTVKFVDEANYDFHLSPNDTSAKDAGAMLCEDAALPFSTDIDGQSRPCSPNTWDIGADEVTQAMIEIKRNVDFGRNVNFKR
jgi:hypothetical protein